VLLTPVWVRGSNPRLHRRRRPGLAMASASGSRRRSTRRRCRCTRKSSRHTGRSHCGIRPSRRFPCKRTSPSRLRRSGRAPSTRRCRTPPRPRPRRLRRTARSAPSSRCPPSLRSYGSTPAYTVGSRPWRQVPRRSSSANRRPRSNRRRSSPPPSRSRPLRRSRREDRAEFRRRPRCTRGDMPIRGRRSRRGAWRTQRRAATRPGRRVPADGDAVQFHERLFPSERAHP
jgi:hypothetical protein